MSSEEFTAPGLPDSALPGRQLAAAREGRGMSVAEIAQQLKLSPWQVEALEAGDYRKLPGAVFVRGFIRNYARLVKLDAASLLAGADQQLPAAAPVAAPAAPPVNIPFPRERRINWARHAVAVVAVLAALAFYEFYPDQAPDTGPKPAQVDAPAAQVVVVAAPAKGADADSAPAAAPAIVVATVDAASPARQLPAESGARTADARAVTITETRHVAGEQVVHLRFARESWVEIRDRNGRKIFSQLNAPGTEQVVSGMPPLSVVVGNANGVQLTHNEQPVNLGKYIKVDVARLTLE